MIWWKKQVLWAMKERCMKVGLTRKDFTREKNKQTKKNLKPTFEKGVRCGQAMENNEDITAPW